LTPTELKALKRLPTYLAQVIMTAVNPVHAKFGDNPFNDLFWARLNITFHNFHFCIFEVGYRGQILNRF